MIKQNLWAALDAVKKIPASDQYGEATTREELWLVIEALNKIAKVLPIDSARDAVEDAIVILINLNESRDRNQQ